MAYKPEFALRVEVPELDPESPPVFVFGSADEAWMAMVGAIRRFGRANPEQSLDAMDFADWPAELTSLAFRLVVDGVKDWSGVVGADGQELRFNKRELQDLPTNDKLRVCGAYLTKRAEVEAGKVMRGE